MTGIVKELGYMYCKEYFGGYKFRAKVCLETVLGHTYQFDIYTTDSNKDSVRLFLESRANQTVVMVKITYWTTRESDDYAKQLIDQL